MKRHWLIYGSILFFIGVMLVFMFREPFNDGSGEANADLFANYGTFIGGLLGTILALISSLLIYFTFLRQRGFFQTERFENRFFEMIKSNREMMQTMEYEVPDEYTPVDNKKAGSNKHNAIIVRGQKVFVQIHKQLKQAQEECAWTLKEITDIKTLFKDDATTTKEINILNSYYGNINEQLFINIHWSNIVYLCIFYGLGEDGQRVLKSRFAETYNPIHTDRVINTLKIKPVKWSDFWTNYQKQKDKGFEMLKEGYIPFEGRKYDKYYGGHVHRLGQYFRNLFTIYNFINTRSFNYQTKYDYVKLLRSQFSTYEQSVFFYNSLSILGRIWDIDAVNNESKCDLIDKQLITKYNLIKNIPTEFISEINIDKYYPLVEFELGNTLSKKEELKKKYK